MAKKQLSIWVEEGLVEQFDGVRVLRMDVDTTRGKNAHDRILSAFGRGEADVLLGTQMVAKGLDFPGVTLVGVISADTGIHLPDHGNIPDQAAIASRLDGDQGHEGQHEKSRSNREPLVHHTPPSGWSITSMYVKPNQSETVLLAPFFHPIQRQLLSVHDGPHLARIQPLRFIDHPNAAFLIYLKLEAAMKALPHDLGKIGDVDSGGFCELTPGHV